MYNFCHNHHQQQRQQSHTRAIGNRLKLNAAKFRRWHLETILQAKLELQMGQLELKLGVECLRSQVCASGLYEAIFTHTGELTSKLRANDSISTSYRSSWSERLAWRLLMRPSGRGSSTLLFIKLISGVTSWMRYSSDTLLIWLQVGDLKKKVLARQWEISRAFLRAQWNLTRWTRDAY